MAETRIHMACFESGDAFLRHYEDMDGHGGIIFPTKATFEEGELLEVEIRFPGLPNRMLLRAEAVPYLASPGFQAVRFLKSEKSKKDFVLAVAKGRARGRRRRHRRFPVELEASWRIEGVQVYNPAVVRDLSRGGLYLETPWSPPVGSHVLIRLRLPGQQEEIELSGRVTWMAQDLRTAHMGVQFTPPSQPALKHVRRFLRHHSDSGVLPIQRPRRQPIQVS